MVGLSRCIQAGVVLFQYQFLTRIVLVFQRGEVGVALKPIWYVNPLIMFGFKCSLALKISVIEFETMKTVNC